MTPAEKFLESLVKTWRVDLLIMSKLGVLLFLGLFILFSLVVVKQVKLMSNTINGVMEDGLVLAARLLVALAVLAFILGLVVL